jgi:hypothetical protein
MVKVSHGLKETNRSSKLMEVEAEDTTVYQYRYAREILEVLGLRRVHLTVHYTGEPWHPVD